MSGGGRFCWVIRHIADHFWINTADYVTAERNLPRISKSRLCRGKSRESETRPLISLAFQEFSTNFDLVFFNST
jgi:hypothetical protein